MARLQRIEVDANLRTHHKAAALAVALQDPRAWTWVVELWMWASQNQPDGLIPGPAARLVLEHVLGWRGTPGLLADSFVACGWLDVTEDGLQIHEWEEHAGAHVAKAERDAERMRAYRSTVRERYTNVHEREANADARNAHVQGNTKRKRNTNPEKQLPSPAAPPVGAAEESAPPHESDDENLPLLSPEESASTDGAAEVVAYYCAAMKANGIEVRPTRSKVDMVRKRIRDGLSVPTLKLAVDGLTWSDWHMGRDAKTAGKKFFQIKYCMDSTDRVEARVAQVPKRARGAA